MSEQDPAIAAQQRFARNLRRERQRVGISQDELADAAGLHRSQISLLERGQREPRLGTIIRLSSALAIGPSVLLDDGD